jgi:hypothetical protein
MKKKYADGGMMRPAVMPGRSGTAGRPDATGLARAAAMSGRTMPTTGRPAMKKGGSVKKYADGGSTGLSRARAALDAARSQNAARRAGMTRANHRAGVRVPDRVPDADGNYYAPLPDRYRTATKEGIAPKAGLTLPAMKKGGKVKKYARGGGIESKGKTRGKFV